MTKVGFPRIIPRIPKLDDGFSYSLCQCNADLDYVPNFGEKWLYLHFPTTVHQMIMILIFTKLHTRDRNSSRFGPFCQVDDLKGLGGAPKSRNLFCSKTNADRINLQPQNMVEFQQTSIRNSVIEEDGKETNAQKFGGIAFKQFAPIALSRITDR